MSIKQPSILGSNQAWLIWIISCFVVVLGFNLQTGYAIVNQDIAHELGMSIAQVALIGSVYAWVFAISQLFSGSILDNLGLQKVFPISVGFITAGAILLATAASFEMVLFSQVFLAFGASFGFVGAGFTGGLWFQPAKFGFMFGLVQTIASLGSFVGQYLYAYLLNIGTTWNQLIWYMAIFGIIMLILTILFTRNPINADGTTNFDHTKFSLSLFGKVFSNIKEVAKIKEIWFAALNGGLTFGVYLAFAILWGPKIIASHGFSAYDSGVLNSVLWIGLAIFSPLCDKLVTFLQKRRPVVLLFTTIQLIAILVLLYIPNLTYIEILILSFLFGSGAAGHMQMFSVGIDLVEPRLIGTSSAIINGTMFVSEAILISVPTSLLVTLTDTKTSYTLEDFSTPMMPYIAGLIVAMMLTYLIKETYHKS